jgi:DNA-binding MarR family transcriptional regulator/GNAT superfamily N-acetyltransferase
MTKTDSGAGSDPDAKAGADAASREDPGLEKRLEIMRSFNRMYMNRIGLLAERIFGSPFSPAEVRVLNEISMQKSTTASALARQLNLDGGYLSRMLHRFEKDGLISKERAKEDARQRNLQLTKKGRKLGDDMLSEARKIMHGIVAPLSLTDQMRMVAAMSTIDRIINRAATDLDRMIQPPYIVRPHRTGDIGLIVHYNAVRFAEDYGFNQEFEALAAEKAGEFLRNYNPARERCLVAEMDDRLVGSVFLVRHTDDVGEVRLLYVAPEARGIGIGKQMLSELMRFARHAGYKKLVMRTESVVEYAVPLFEAAGMKIARETPHHRFGQNLVGQDWEMAL